ncbi:hypothetical protein GCM10027570_31010 [Streptomonospora sediminis]
MSTSRFAPDWRRILRGAAIGCAATAGVGLAVYSAAELIGTLTADAVIGANIGLGIGAFAVRLVATPLVGWWLLRLAKVPRAGLAAVIGLVCYLLLAVPAWGGDPALPGAIAAWLVLGALAGAVGVYAAGTTARPAATGSVSSP